MNIDNRTIGNRTQPSLELNIEPPNEFGSENCIVNWHVETPHGWVGAWNKEALEYILAAHRPNDLVRTIPEEWPTNAMIEAGRRAVLRHGPHIGSGQSLWHLFRDMLHASQYK